jgi:hypothetical protein
VLIKSWNWFQRSVSRDAILNINYIMAGQSRRLLRAQTSLNTVYVIRVDVLFSDDFDSLEDEVVEVSPLDEESEDDCIDPLLFVQKYINSDDILKR